MAGPGFRKVRAGATAAAVGVASSFAGADCPLLGSIGSSSKRSSSSRSSQLTMTSLPLPMVMV